MFFPGGGKQGVDSVRSFVMPGSFSSGACLKLFEKRIPKEIPRGVPAEKRKEELHPRNVIICRHCRKHITDESQRISVDGAHRHTFANPHGHVYDIGCFGSAVGCTGAGPAFDEFTWFRGYSWRVVICSGCSAHLGWLFQSSGDHHFYGLILDRLAGSL